MSKTDQMKYTTVAMPGEEAPPLSSRRAFVVQFRIGAGAEPARFTGRVEHMTSGQATRFESVEDLVAFITRVLAEVRE